MNGEVVLTSVCRTLTETPSEAQPGQANPVVAQEWCDQFLKAGEAATDIYEAEEPTRLPAIFMVVARSGRRLWTGPTTAVFPKEAVHSTTGMKILRVLGLLALLVRVSQTHATFLR